MGELVASWQVTAVKLPNQTVCDLGHTPSSNNAALTGFGA